MNDLDTHSLILGFFMSVTLDAAVHLGKDCLENLHSTKSQAHRTIKQFFDVSQKLITAQTETQGISKIGWYTHSWQRTILLTDKAVQLSTAKVFVFSDSVLCLGKMHQYPESIVAWKKKIEWFTDSPQYGELDRIDGEPTEFEWNIFKGLTTLQFLAEIQKMMDKMQFELEHFTARIFFMSMYNDIVRGSTENKKKVLRIL